MQSQNLIQKVVTKLLNVEFLIKGITYEKLIVNFLSIILLNLHRRKVTLHTCIHTPMHTLQMHIYIIFKFQERNKLQLIKVNLIIVWNSISRNNKIIHCLSLFNAKFFCRCKFLIKILKNIELSKIC